MNKLLLAFSLLFSGLLMAQPGPPKDLHIQVAKKSSQEEYIPNTIIVKFRENAGATARVQAQAKVVTLKTASVEVLKQKFPQKASGRAPSVLKLEDKSGLNRIYELKFSGNTSVESVIEELSSNPDVEYAEPSYIRHTYYTSNDPGYSGGSQAYLNLINAPSAWDRVRNTPNVIIGIVDSGSQLNHEDLAANIYYNLNDPINGLDDDGDGFVDNYQGWDFVGASSSNIKDDNDPNIINSRGEHGLHVSGIAGAVTDNGRGVASASFNTAKLLILKASADDDGTDIYRGYEAIKYAADHGAHIINCSWGGESRSLFEQDVVNYAISKGSLIVAAAGNSGSDVPQYPAGYEGVLAVANLNLNDERNSSSNYGYYVSIAAPGTDIRSTTFPNAYGVKSGTSMASPVVAAAAALVKAYMPGLTMQQVREQLRSTADNIDLSNPGFEGKLGKGRLNLLRALTETPPSIRQQRIAFTDKGGGTLPAGDTISIFIDLKNFLFPVSNLQVHLSSDNNGVDVTEADRIVPAIGQLQTVNNIGPFKVYIKPTIEDNAVVQFRLDYIANNGSYQDFEGFTLVVSRDFLNMETASIATTVTSKGRTGFLIPGVDDGSLGFRYKGRQLLYEAALMVGNADTRVSNSARSGGENYDDHFVRQQRVVPANTSDYQEARTEFDDSANPDGLGVYIRQTSRVSNINNDKYLINEYEVFNHSNVSLSNVFVGLFTDWDIEGGSTNATHYDASLKLAYVYDKKNATLPYAGVKILSDNSAPNYYPLSYMIKNDPLEGDFTIAEKYQTLSNGIKSSGLGENTNNGLDVSFVTSAGPYSIPANGSVKVAFAVIGGDNLDDLKKSAAAAQAGYEVMSPTEPQPEITDIAFSAYPNPITSESGSITLEFQLPREAQVSLDLYDVMGRRVKRLIRNEKYIAGKHRLVYSNSADGEESVNRLSSGIYFYRLSVGGTTKTSKISIVR